MFTVKKFLFLSVLFAAQNILVGADQAPVGVDSVEKEVNKLYNTFSSWQSLEEKKKFFSGLAGNIEGLNSKRSEIPWMGGKVINVSRIYTNLFGQIDCCKQYVNSCYAQFVSYLLASIGSLWGGIFIPLYAEIFIPSLKTVTFSSYSIDKLSLVAGSSLAFLLLGAAGYKYIHYRSLRKAVESEEFRALQGKAFDPKISSIIPN